MKNKKKIITLVLSIISAITIYLSTDSSPQVIDASGNTIKGVIAKELKK